MTAAVFIPGTLCDRRVFEPMADHLAREPHFAAPIDRDNVVEAAEAMLADAPPRFIACGFSLGGFVVLEIMRRAPQRLRGAVLIASNAHTMQPGAEAGRRAEVAKAKQFGVEAVVEELWPLYVAPSRHHDNNLKQLIRDMASAVGADRFAAQAELAINRPDSSATIRATHVPLLALCGAEDAMSPIQRSQSFTEGRDARLIVLPDVGHFVPLEAPDAAAAAITAWAEELTLCC